MHGVSTLIQQRSLLQTDEGEYDIDKIIEEGEKIAKQI